AAAGEFGQNFWIGGLAGIANFAIWRLGDEFRLGGCRKTRPARKRTFWVQKAGTMGRGRRGWLMNAWPKATESKSCCRKTRLSPRTCTCPTGSRSEEGRQEVIRDDEVRKND